MSAETPTPFKTIPFAHQLEEFERSKNERARAILWEQGTGKSKLIVDTACHLWQERKIDSVLVVAPSGVHRNWIEQEFPLHTWDVCRPEVRAFAYSSAKAGTQQHAKELVRVTAHRGLAVLAISYDSFLTVVGKSAVIEFMHRREDLLFVLDEAQYIKNPDAKRTRTLLKAGAYGTFRRILTGTPVAQGPFDLFAQIAFLDPSFWRRAGLGSYVEYTHHFGLWEKAWNPTAWNPKTRQPTGAFYDRLKSYRRMDELGKLIKPISSRVTKDAVLDLPPKLYTKRLFTMSDEQRRHYAELRDEYMTWVQTQARTQPVERQVCSKCGGTREVEVEGMIYPCEACPPLPPDGDTLIAAPLVMVRLLRLQQVTCGYLPTALGEEEPVYQIPGPNRRLEHALDICEQAQHKVIVWARFKLDIELLLKGLAERGIAAVRYDGAVGEEERAEAKARFTGRRPVYLDGQVVGEEAVPAGEQAKVFVGNPAAGATGLTLVEAKTVVYYSNSFKLLDRLQSEDRAHRIGQTNAVLYVDIVAEDTIDDKIVDSLRMKKTIADEILGDAPKEWI